MSDDQIVEAIWLKQIASDFARYVESDTKTNCWNWTGERKKGIPIYMTTGLQNNLCVEASKLAFILHTGDGIEANQIRNICGNENCVSPLHHKPKYRYDTPEKLRASRRLYYEKRKKRLLENKALEGVSGA